MLQYLNIKRLLWFFICITILTVFASLISLSKLLKTERWKRMWFNIFWFFLNSSHNALSFRIIFFSSTWSWTTFVNFKQPRKISWPFFPPFTLQVPRSHTNSPHWAPYISLKNSWENLFLDQSILLVMIDLIIIVTLNLVDLLML